MSGIFGAIRLAPANSGYGPGELVALMLAASKTEPFYTSKKWKCPTGNACFASSGLSSLQQGAVGSPGFLEGVIYGKMSFSDSEGVWLSGVRGSFSAAMRDSRGGSYTIVADRSASEPVYHTECLGHLCFASECGALISLPGVSRDADFGALSSLLLSGHLLEDTTLFRGVRRLPGGQALRVQNGSTEKLVYWRFAPGSREPVGEQELLDRLDGTLCNAVESSIGGTPGETAVFLSGGYDSRAILGYARRIPGLCTVSWGATDSSPGTDAELAGKLASICGANHLFLKRDLPDYGKLFEEAAAVTEYQSDVAAFHPQEFRLMRQLQASGIRRVVRGDETFGWKKQALSPHGALARVGLRRFGLVEGFAEFFRPGPARLLKAASEAQAGALISKASDMSWNQFKDQLYFTQRLQNYLNSCAVFKQRLFEHSNPLLSDEVLDLLCFVPEALRTDKRLLRLLVARQFPELHAVRYASADGLEDWPKLRSSDSPLRRYLKSQLDDEESGVWTLFDRRHLLAAFHSCRDSGRYSVGGLVGRGLTRLSRDILKPVSPQGADHFQAMLNLRTPISNTKALLRFLVVKQWVDRCCPVLH
jgi:asparagine synthetase B (glutamine-hydrolysing)